MEITGIILLVVLVVVVVYFVMIYNQLVQVKHNVSKAWANIDVLLKQRHDELPKLVETCKQYMKFEQDTLVRVMEARSQRLQRARAAEHRRPGPGRRRAARRARQALRARGSLPGAQDRPDFPAPAEPHLQPRERDRRPARVLQRVGQHQQRAHRAVPRFDRRGALQLQADGSCSSSPTQETADVDVKQLFQA